MTKIFFTRHSVGRFGTDDDECSRLSETGRRDDGPVQIPLQKKRMWTAPTAGAICGTPVRNLFAHTFRSGWKQGLLAIRSLRRDASAWQATRSYGSGPALFPKGIRFLLRWNRPIGTGCLSGRRPAQPLSAPRSWRRFICSPPGNRGSGGECLPHIYPTAGIDFLRPFPCGGSTRGTIR